MLFVRRSVRLILFALLILGTAGCDEDDPSAPEEAAEGFEVVLHCVDADGQPLVGAPVGMSPSVPLVMDPFRDAVGRMPAPQKSYLRVTLDFVEAARVRVSIRDVERRHVRTIFDAFDGEGIVRCGWDGRPADSNEHTPPGYYEVLLEILVADRWAPIDSVGAIQAAFDPGQYTIGVTDANGALLIVDRRLFPAFFDILPMAYTNEDGNVLGDLDIGEESWFLAEVAPGDSRWGRAVVRDVPSQELTVVFGEHSAPDAGSVASAPPAVGRRKDARVRIDSITPNPFN